MRAGCVVALTACLATWAFAAEQEFPYTAYVAVSQASIRSGPGRNFYATGKLDQRETVEVYRHEGDWCGIRPTAGSFSWVKADDLQIGRDGLGLVLTDGAACRVGSGTSGLRDVIQVRLQRGEQVEILDAVQTSNDNGIEFYCKIAPPSGEFRWIHKDDISREDPGLAGDDEVTPRDRTSLARFEEQQDESAAARSDRWGSWVRSRRGAAGQGNSARHESEIEAGQSTAIAASERGAPADDRQDPASDLGAPRKSPAEEVEAIDRELSRVVVSEPVQWNFAEIQERIEALTAKTITQSTQEAIEDLKERLARFEDIRTRSLEHAKADGVAPAGALPPALNTAHSPPAVPGRRPPDEAGESGRYDGVGRLTRVVSQRPNAPRFALVDGRNEVVSFVSPAPGVNLHTYEGQYIGITGARGYMPELKKAHVTALRVTPLSMSVAERRIGPRR
jgi:hypothetical protein